MKITETDKIFDWIKNPNNTELYYGTVFPYLFDKADLAINLHLRNYAAYGYQKNELIREMVSFASQLLISKYDCTKSKVITFVMMNYRNYLIKIYHFNATKSRNWLKKVYIEDLEAAHFFLSENKQQDSYLTNDSFKNYFCNWWRANMNRIPKHNHKYIIAIVDIIQRPQDYPLTGEDTYIHYLCRKFNISRQALNLLFHKMRKYKKEIIQEWQGNSLFEKIFA